MEKTFNGERKMSPRLSAAFALVMLGRTEVSEFSPLQYLVNTLNSAAWRGVARAFLVETARQETVRRTLEQATKSGTKSEKVELAYILSVSGDRASVPYLEAMTHDSNSEVASAALDGMRSLKARLP
jgi:hypothetical protein